MSIGGGKSGSSGSSTSIPTLSPEQNAQIKAQTQLFQQYVAPSYATAVQGATGLYNQEAPGVTNAAQNYAGTANQAQNVLGSTGESALTTGINALQNLDSPDYQKAQMNAALLPAEAQYAQNIAGQQAQFGGAGQLGSARSALAQSQTAAATQAAQQQAAAQVLNNIAQQQQSAGTTLAQLGQGGLTGAQAAASNQINAAMAPQQLYNQYAGVLFGTPSASYSPNFAGTQAVTTTNSNQAYNGQAGLNFSDIKLKENIIEVGTKGQHKLYEFNYIGDNRRFCGVMAQDVEKYMPEAVHNINGMLAVDYDMLGLAMKEIA